VVAREHPLMVVSGFSRPEFLVKADVVTAAP
jgi:hypothetical protein